MTNSYSVISAVAAGDVPSWPEVGKRNGDSIVWDGGPAIILQASAASKWTGADDFDNSRMSAGAVETDYDVACEAEEWRIERHGREMLVLIEKGGAMFALPSGVVVFSRRDGGRAANTRAAEALLNDLSPAETFPFHIQDTTLRLLPAADDGDGSVFGYVEVPVRPGVWKCHVSDGPDGLLLVLQPPAETTK